MKYNKGMTTNILKLHSKECELIPGTKVAAYTDHYLDEENPTDLILDTTWDKTTVDLTPAIKAGETVTRLYLAPENSPTVLKYEREDGEIDCIPGDELSRIISLKLLKDVDQSQPVGDGDVLMYNENTGLFEPFDLKTFVNNTNTRLGRLESRMSAVEGRIDAIEAVIPFWSTDKTMKLARGTINLYSDVSNTDDKTDGLFTHDKSIDKTNDEYFS